VASTSQKRTTGASLAIKANGFVMISTEDLREVIRETNAPETRQPVWSDSTMASIGRLVKMSDIMKKIGLGKL
jgi:hypothetical protein